MIRIKIIDLKITIDKVKSNETFFLKKTNGYKGSKDKSHKDQKRQDKVGRIKLTEKHIDIVMKDKIKIANINNTVQLDHTSHL